MNINEMDRFGIEPSLINEYIEKIDKGDKIVAVAGEFSSGKSTFVNAFLDKKGFIPSAKIECTPVLLDLVQCDDDVIELTYKDGTYEKIDYNEENIRKYASNADDYDKNILSISIPIKSDYLLDNTHLIDTPGSNTIYKEHGEITSSVLKKADIVLYVIKVGLTKVDLQNISEIMKYSSQILFIVSHMDEKDGETYVNSSNERVQKCIEEIISELKKNLGIEAPDILPIGSLAYYNDDSMMKEIRECVKYGIKSNSMKVLKNRVKKQLKYLLKNKYDEYTYRYEMMKKLPEENLENLENQYKSLNEKINKINIQNAEQIKALDYRFKNESDNAERKLERIFDEECDNFLKCLLGASDISEELLNENINKIGNIISSKYKELLENSISRVIEITYEEKNNELDKLTEDLHFNFSVNMHPPALEEIDLSEIEDRLFELREEKREISKEIKIAESEAAITMENQEMLQQKISEAEYKESEVIREKNSISYTPEYEEVIEEGYGNTGRRVGRFIGEVADMVLIFVDPSKTALKVADTIKDGTKVASYIKRGVDSAEKAVKTAKKVVDTAKKADKLGKIVDALDWMSIGKYGEILGEKIGNVIKPTKTVLVEDEAKRAQWENEMKEINFRLDEVRRNRIDIEDKIADGEISIIQAKRKISEFDAKLAQMEEREKDITARLKKEAEKDAREKINDYYREAVMTKFAKQKEEALNSLETLLKYNYNMVLEKCSLDFSKKVSSIRENIESILKEKDNLEKEIKRQKELIEEFSNYEQWVEEWVQ